MDSLSIVETGAIRANSEVAASRLNDLRHGFYGFLLLEGSPP
jgi:hypothetical protein